MVNSASAELDALITDFTNQLRLVMRRSALEEVVAALRGDATAPAIKRRGRPPGSKNKMPAAKAVRAKAPAGGKRTPEAVAQMGERLLNYVKAKPGLRADQIAKVFHTDVKTIRLPMQRLLAEKKIRTEGQRRGMRYYAGGGGKPKPSPKKARRGATKKAGASAKRTTKAAPKAKKSKAKRGARNTKSMAAKSTSSAQPPKSPIKPPQRVLTPQPRKAPAAPPKPVKTKTAVVATSATPAPEKTSANASSAA